MSSFARNHGSEFVSLLTKSLTIIVIHKAPLTVHLPPYVSMLADLMMRLNTCVIAALGVVYRVPLVTDENLTMAPSKVGLFT